MKRTLRLALSLALVWVVFGIQANAQWVSNACPGVTVTATTSSPMSGQPDCAGIVATLLPGGWDGASGSGFIRYNWPSPISSVRIEFYSVNTNDYATVTTNGGGALTITSVGTCSSVSGTVIGPYLGGGAFGTVAYNVSATIPFTMLNVQNTGAQSGWVTDCPVNVILATELAHFSARNDGEGTVKLDWQSAQETNSAYYGVERSADGIAWEEIGQVQAVANSTSLVSYSYKDHLPHQGRNYYRLRAVSQDGSFTQSGVQESMVGAYIQVYPSPTRGELHVRGVEDASRLRIHDNLGREVSVPVQTEAEGLMLDLSQLLDGMYILRMQQDGEILTRKVWKD